MCAVFPEFHLAEFFWVDSGQRHTDHLLQHTLLSDSLQHYYLIRHQKHSQGNSCEDCISAVCVMDSSQAWLKTLLLLAACTVLALQTSAKVVYPNSQTSQALSPSLQ